MTADEIRAIPIPFLEKKIEAGTPVLAVDSAIKALELQFLREIAAQLAEGVRYLVQISEELQTIRNKFP